MKNALVCTQTKAFFLAFFNYLSESFSQSQKRLSAMQL